MSTGEEVAIQGKTIRVFCNPDHEELVILLSHSSLFGLIDGRDDLWVWYAHEASHPDLEQTVLPLGVKLRMKLDIDSLAIERDAYDPRNEPAIQRAYATPVSMLTAADF